MFSLLFLMIDLHFLIPAVIARFFNPTALIIGIQTNKAKAEL